MHGNAELAGHARSLGILTVAGAGGRRTMMHVT